MDTRGRGCGNAAGCAAAKGAMRRGRSGWTTWTTGTAARTGDGRRRTEDEHEHEDGGLGDGGAGYVRMDVATSGVPRGGRMTNGLSHSGSSGPPPPNHHPHPSPAPAALTYVPVCLRFFFFFPIRSPRASAWSGARGSQQGSLARPRRTLLSPHAGFAPRRPLLAPPPSSLSPRDRAP